MSGQRGDTIIIETAGDASVGIEGAWLELRGLDAWLDNADQSGFIKAELTRFFSDLLDDRARVWLPGENPGLSE